MGHDWERGKARIPNRVRVWVWFDFLWRRGGCDFALGTFGAGARNISPLSGHPASSDLIFGNTDGSGGSEQPRSRSQGSRKNCRCCGGRGISPTAGAQRRGGPHCAGAAGLPRCGERAARRGLQPPLPP